MDKYIMHWKVAKIFLLHFLHGQTSWGHTYWMQLSYSNHKACTDNRYVSDTIYVDDILCQICHIFIAFFCMVRLFEVRLNAAGMVR